MKNKQGFSIIEVVLVIGIAGIILTMAFIALPSLWRSQRDADRRANVMGFISSVKTYQTNNSRGALPNHIYMPGYGDGNVAYFNTTNLAGLSESSFVGDWVGFLLGYVDLKHEDPSGNTYGFKIYNDCRSSTGTSLGVGEACAYDTYGVTDDPDASYADDYPTLSAVNGDDIPNFNPDLPIIYVVKNATCDGDTIVKTSSTRSVAALQVLERGRYCYNT